MDWQQDQTHVKNCSLTHSRHRLSVTGRSFDLKFRPQEYPCLPRRDLLWPQCVISFGQWPALGPCRCQHAQVPYHADGPAAGQPGAAALTLDVLGGSLSTHRCGNGSWTLTAGLSQLREMFGKLSRAAKHPSPESMLTMIGVKLAWASGVTPALQGRLDLA